MRSALPPLAALLLAPGVSLAASAAPARLTLTLADAERDAFARSPSLRAAEEEADAAQNRQAVVFTGLLPKLSLDGSWRYVTEIPEIRLSPLAPPLAFGTHDSYSVGPALAWNLWDSGATWNAWHAASALARARRQEAAALRAALRLRVRTAYFTLRLAIEQERLLAGSLATADAQARDIALRAREGSSSRADVLAASNEALSRRAAHRQIRADIAVDLRELAALTGARLPPDLSYVAADGASAPPDTSPPTLLLQLDSIEDGLRALAPAAEAPFVPSPARVRALSEVAEAARRQVAALESQHWPTVRLSAKSSLDYPNGPVAESVRQSMVAVTATWPLYSFGQVSRQVAEAQAQARAASDRTAAAREDAERDWLASRERIAALAESRALLSRVAAQAKERAGLVYETYRHGGAAYLEVQQANLGALASAFDAAQAGARLALQLSLAASRSE